MDTTLSIKVPGTVVPYVIYLASKNCIILRAGHIYIRTVVATVLGFVRNITYCSRKTCLVNHSHIL